MGTEGYKFPAKDKYAIRGGLDDMLKLELENRFHHKWEERCLYALVGFAIAAAISFFDSQSFFEIARVVVWISLVFSLMFYFIHKKKYSEGSSRRLEIYLNLHKRGYSVFVNAWDKLNKINIDNPRNWVEVSIIKADGAREKINLNPYDDASYDENGG